MKVLLRILSAFLLLTIPAIPVLSALNLTSRAPDLYTYEFTKAKAANELEITMDGKMLGAFFSDYFMGKEETFEYYSDLGEDGYNLFTQKEAGSMQHFKSLLDESIIFLAAVFLITSVAYWLLMRYNKAGVIRNRFLWSLVFYAGFWIFLLILLLIKPDVILISTGGLVDQLINARFVRDWYLASFAISTVMIVILASISWRITRPRRLFR